MASGITRDIGAPNRIIDTVADKELVMERDRRLGLTERQVELNRRYAYYRTQQYDTCMVDWDGSQHADTLTRESIASQAVLPPGYQDPGGGLANLPLRYRRPSAPAQLGKVVVDRFSDLLFSEQQNPLWKVPGDADTEAWCQEVTKRYMLMSTAALCRSMGGAMGTAVIGFKLINGRVVFEEFDARWCFPSFDAKDPTELVELEIRYMYPKEERDPETGAWKEERYWYRRIIDREVDCLWKAMPVGDGSEEPNWTDPATVDSMVKHDLGFVPVEWIQNLRVSGDIDGDPDVLGCYDNIDRISELRSGAHKAALRNADPTPHIASDGSFQTVTLGSDSAIQTEKGGQVGYLESQGSGAKTALEVAAEFRREVLETCACVLPEEEKEVGSGSPTATEIVKRVAAMHAKASKLREQYGAGLVKLMRKLITSVVKLGMAKADGGQIVRRTIDLPQRLVDGNWQDHKIGATAGKHLELVWPPFSAPTPQDTATKVTATVAARNGRVITLGTAVRHVSPDFNIEDPNREVEQLQKEPPPGGDLAAQSLKELNEGR